MIYVYAITDRPEAPLPRQLGLQDAELARIAWCDVAAIVSAFDGTRLSETADEVWRHEEVVEELMIDRAVLPARFGTLSPSRQHVGAVLRRANRALLQDIDRVRGQVEIGMRFLSASEDDAQDRDPPTSFGVSVPTGAGPGSIYLRARIARERALRNRQQAKLVLVEDVYRQLASRANASRLDDESDDRNGISAAFLVSRDGMESFRDLISGVTKAHPELAMLCTGPWPPYSFVNAAPDAASWRDEPNATE
jgi:Gas vesicle synthesis protein GvpL/GvpF